MVEHIESWLQPGQALQIFVLPLGGVPVPGLLVDRTGPQLILSLAENVPFGSAVKIETADVLLLGDVSHCEPCASGYTIGVTARYVMPESADLARLNRSLKEAQGANTPRTEPLPCKR